MLVQPDHPSSSVKLRRKNRHSEFADSNDVKRRNRYSGGEFLVGSPVSRGHVQQPPAGGQAEAMRKSGDWSYVSFPSSKSPPVTPKLTSKRPLSLMQNHHQPISLLETKVMASIIHNNSQRGGHHEVSSKSAHCTPVAMQKLHKSSDMSLDYSSLGSEAKSRYENHENPEEYTKLLRRRMISEVLQKPPNNDIWQLQQQQQPNSESAGNRSRNQRETKRRNQRRSHSAQGRRSETQSEVNAVKPSKPLTPTKPGLGRRSATQLEISRRKTKEESPALMQKTKWHSQENLDTVSSPPLAPLRNGNFAGGRRELALRLLSNGQEEETDEHLDAAEEDDDDEEILIGNSSKNRFVSAAPQSLISGLDPPNSHSSPNLKKGILWQQRDKIFARWKERFFVLTKDYLQCFKKGTSRITEMGGFIYGIRLSEIVDVQLLDKRGYLTICLTLAAKDGKLFLRKPEGIRDWYQTLKTSTQACKERRSMQSTEEFWSRKQFDGGNSNNIEQWLIARQRIGMKYNYASPACSSPSTTWERENNEPKSMPDPEIRRCRTPKSAPNSRPQSSTRSTSRQRRSLSQHPNPSNMGVEHVYETPKNEGVTSPSNSARSSRLSNGFFRDSGNDTMYTSSGGSTDSSNREQLKNHANSQRQAPPQRRYSEAAKRISASNLDNFSPSASSTPKKSPYHRHLPSQATRV